MPRNQRPLRYLRQYELSPNFTQRKYYFENFVGGQQPIFYQHTSGLSVAPTTTTITQGVTVHSLTPSGGYWNVFTTTDQDLLPTGSATNGLDIAGDLVDNEALEIVPGGNAANSRLAFTVGTDSDFFLRAKLKITDVDGSDQFLVGFRKQEPFAVPTSFLNTGDGIYTDFFGIGFAATVASPNDVRTAYDLNNGGSTTVTDTGFNWADGEVHEVQLRVVGAKAVVLINGVRIGNPIAKDGDGAAITSQSTFSAPSFTFDSGDTLVPFIFLRHDAAISNAHYLRELEIGHLVEAGLDPNAL